MTIVERHASVRVTNGRNAEGNDLGPNVASLATRLPLIRRLLTVLEDWDINDLNARTALARRLRLERNVTAKDVQLNGRRSRVSTVPLTDRLLNRTLLLARNDGVAPISNVAKGLSLTLADLISPRRVRLVRVDRDARVCVRPLNVLYRFELPCAKRIRK